MRALSYRYARYGFPKATQKRQHWRRPAARPRPRPRGARLQLPETRNKNPVTSYKKQVTSNQREQETVEKSPHRDGLTSRCPDLRTTAKAFWYVIDGRWHDGMSTHAEGHVLPIERNASWVRLSVMVDVSADFHSRPQQPAGHQDSRSFCLCCTRLRCRAPVDDSSAKHVVFRARRRRGLAMRPRRRALG